MQALKLLPRFRRARREFTMMESRERWPRVDIAAYQLQRLNRLWGHAIEHVPYYRQLSETAALPPQFSDLRDFQAAVPMISKDQVSNRQNDFLSAQADAGRWYHSGGSTGVPTSYFRSREAQLEMLRGRYRFHAMWDVDIFDRWVHLWGHAASFAPGLPGQIARLRQPIHDRLRNRRRLSAYRLGRDQLRDHLRRIAAFRPVGVYAYSTAAYLLAREAEATGFSCPSLKLIVLTAEPVLPHIVKTCEQAFGVPAVVEYGSAEFGLIAAEWPDRTIRVREDNLLVETPPREDGRFDIVITALNSSSFPLIRYAIGDVTDAPLDDADTGFAILKNIVGRHQDLIISSCGHPLHAGWFQDILEHTAGVRRYQVHQRVSGDLVVSLEQTRPDVPIDLPSVAKTLREHVGYPVSVQVVAALDHTPAGKHRWITSAMAQTAAS